MLKVGITGEMGSGKTYISNLFAEKGVPVYNCDRASKKLVSSNPDLIEEIKKYFGENIYEGNVFKNLSEIVFTQDPDSAKNLKILSDIIHPYIYEDIDNFCKLHSEGDAKFCLIESAILYENKMDRKLDMVIYVSVPETIRKQRAMTRDNITEKEYNIRMKTQLPSSEKTMRSNYILYNSGSNKVIPRINELYTSINWLDKCKQEKLSTRRPWHNL